MVVERVGDQSPTQRLTRPFDHLDKLVDDARTALSREQRSESRWDSRINEEGATWSGWLVDAAENQVNVTLRTVVGLLRGTITHVGQNAVQLQEGRATTAVAMDAIFAGSTGDSRVCPQAASDRSSGEFSLSDVLAKARDDRSDISVELVDGGEKILGRVRSLGFDVVSVGETNQPATQVRISAIAVIRVRP